MEKLGIQLPVLIAQMINFGILLIVLNKLLYKPMLKFLTERKQKIAEGLKLREQMEVEKEKLDKKQQALLKESREEAAKIVAGAKQDAKKLKEELVAAAKGEIEESRKKATRELTAKYDKMAAELTEQTVDVAEGMAEKLLAGVLSVDAQKKLFARELKRLKNDVSIKH